MPETKIELSGSTSGKGVKVAKTATAGTTVHAAHPTSLDELYIWALNSGTGTSITFEVGGVTDPDNLVHVPLKPNSFQPVIEGGIAVTGSISTAAFTEVANEVVLYGYAKRTS